MLSKNILGLFYPIGVDCVCFERGYSRLYYHRVRDKPVSPELLRAAHSILWILYLFLSLLDLTLECLGLECGPPKSVVPDANRFSINRVHSTERESESANVHV